MSLYNKGPFVAGYYSLSWISSWIKRRRYAYGL